MRWIIMVQCVADDGTKSMVTLGTIERAAGCTTAQNVGASLQESKEILQRLQETVTKQQLQEHCEQKRKCPSCGFSRPVKDYRRRHLDTVLGTVRLKAPRYHACRHCAGTRGSNPLAELLPERTTPELRHLQVSLGAQISYRKAANLLRQLLPATGGTTHTTTRSRVMAIGECIDEEIRQEIRENRTAEKPVKQMVIGIDGAFIKGRRPTDPASLEVITGRIETETEPSKVFGVVRDRDGKAKLQALLRRSGRGPETKVRVVSDGEDGMRSMVGRWFNGNEQHVLDWYHIARRFEAIGKSLLYLPHVEDFGNWLGRHWHHLSRARWKVWHGNLSGAEMALTCFYDGVDMHPVLAEKESRRTTSLQEIGTRLNELWSYLTANEKRLINYGKEYRDGNPISTARVESTVNQLVDWRMEKKQHMRWTQRGAQMLLHARCALLNGNLGKYTGWLPSGKSRVEAVAA